jgi:4-hydroxy-tetrahydrodipicolinate reductase
MKIVISGYGKMGKEIEKAALARGHQIVAKLETADDWSLQKKLIRQADMVIDFSMPGSALNNIRNCFDLRLPVVVGTTGWLEGEGVARKWCREEDQAIFVASNFSIGVNILYNLTEQLAKIMDRLDSYEIYLEEIHHIHKLDAPSGTAIKLAEIILSNVERKKKWVNRMQARPEELQILSVREGEIPGIHKISCESDSDKLTLKHIAKGRKGFAIGAMLAAEWMQGKKGFFGMEDLLRFPLS